MEISSWALLALSYLVSLAFLSKILRRQQPKRKLPPGPKPWPIIGNFNLIGPIPHQSLHSLSQKYGDIMLLKFGLSPASSPEMAKQFLRVHDTVFASRPVLAAGKYTGYNYSNMSWSSYGPYWRQARKIFLSEMFNVKKLDSFEHIRTEERRNFLSRLRSLSGKPVVLRDHLSRYTLSTISRMVLSSIYFGESDEKKSVVKLEELKGMLDEWFFLNGVFNIGDWIPWLSFLDVQGYVKRMKALHRKLDKFFSHVISDHQTRRADSSSKDMVDVLLQLVEDPPNPQVKLTTDSIKGLLQDLLAGGTDTSAIVIEWTIYEIMKNPRIAEKAKEELDKVVGRKRWVEEEDFSKLPYLDAIMMESLRLHPIATFLAPHCAAEDCKVAGYDVPKGTVILINTWTIGRDPKSWDSPLEFLPERFVGKNVDMKGSNFSFLPFGSGRRKCPGYRLGLKLVRTMLANLLHGFNFRLVDGMSPEDICMEEEYGLTTHPKHPLSIIMEPTLPDNFYRTKFTV
ncbi:UNVERIFIED_CONTAM: Trimethyltridecatetraene synthase [Sesamum radiatum]|uniref:Trimethyltridecatetraene synthase n=1 Tax=Sesamum radiatum TaxID=300843 RepID=A0AAW2PX82_SESRA